VWRRHLACLPKASSSTNVSIRISSISLKRTMWTCMKWMAHLRLMNIFPRRAVIKPKAVHCGLFGAFNYEILAPYSIISITCNSRFSLYLSNLYGPFVFISIHFDPLLTGIYIIVLILEFYPSFVFPVTDSSRKLSIRDWPRKTKRWFLFKSSVFGWGQGMSFKKTKKIRN